MEEKIVTIPNIITLGRLLLVPFFIIMLAFNKVEIAVLLFTAIAMSDALDGISARMMKQKTKMGALLDSITDMVVLLSTLITFIFIKGYIQISKIIILLIPVGIGFIVKGVYVKKKNETSPTIIGKVAVALAYVTTIAFLIDFRYKNLFLIAVVLIAYATVATYIVKDVKLFIR